MKRKNPGISSLISLGISFLALGIAISVITSVNTVVQKSADLGRSAQVFFAAESGLESAFFHHNARGQGVHFAGASTPQTITLPNSSAEVSWKLEGRSSPIDGMLREGQKIQIPFFWDDSSDPTETPNQDGLLSNDFTLTLSNTDIPFDFNFGTANDAVLIDWSVSREHNTDGLQTFVPKEGTLSPCGIDTTFICRDWLLGGTASIDSSLATMGTILPGGDSSILNIFMSDGDSSKFTLSFQPLLSFTDTNNIKIEGIPWELAAGGDDLPMGTYTVSAEVSLGDFSKIVTAEVPERTTIGAFDYIIFD